MIDRRLMIDRRRFLGRLSLPAALSLAGCSGWWGAPEEAPLPGDRVPVMLLDEEISADPRVADIEISLPAPEVNPDWPKAGGHRTHALYHLALADSPSLAWRASIGEGRSGSSRLLSQPVVADDRVFVMDAGGAVSALDAADGSRIWRYEPDGVDDSSRQPAGGLAFAGGWIFATTGSGNVIGLNALTGSEVWRRPLQAPIRTGPTPVGNRLLVVTAVNELFALRGDTGDVLWRHAGFFEQAAILGGAAPAANDRVAVVAYSSGEVFALELESGREVWQDTVERPRRTLAIGAISDITGNPVIDRDRVVVAGNGGEMASIDLGSGARNWDLDITSAHTPWVAGDYIYVLSERNELVCLLRQGGRVRWVSPLGRLLDPDDPDSGRIYWAGPVLAGDRLLLAGSTGEAISVSPYTGEILGRIDLPGGATIPPVVAARTLYLLADSGELLAYR